MRRVDICLLCFLSCNNMNSLVLTDLFRSALSYWSLKQYFWRLFLDASEMYSWWTKGLLCTEICTDGRMQYKTSCGSWYYGGVLCSHGGSKNRHKYDTSCLVQLGVSVCLYAPKLVFISLVFHLRVRHSVICVLVCCSCLLSWLA